MKFNKIQKTAFVLFLLNTALLCIKLIGYLTTQSIALQSEAANSAIDTLYMFLVFLGLHFSTKQPTDKYPEGYRRVEPFVSLLISFSIFATGATVAFNSIQTYTTGTTSLSSPLIAITSLIVTITTKYGMFYYIKRQQQSRNSPSITALGKDSLNDILTAVAALIGIGATLSGYLWIEPVVAFLISTLIIYTGVQIAKENIAYILAQAPSEQEQYNICKAALQTENVEGIHDISIHHSGPRLDISMHIEVKGNLTVEQAHNIEIAVADNIRESTSHSINEINLHIDPHTLDEWKSTSYTSLSELPFADNS